AKSWISDFGRLKNISSFLYSFDLNDNEELLSRLQQGKQREKQQGRFGINHGLRGMSHGLYGPTYGSGPDLIIFLGGTGNYGRCHKTDSYEYGLLGGENERIRFEFDEIEIFQIIN
ncbi:12951_t:CDS:1, partial [Ambispora leptoticha]